VASKNTYGNSTCESGRVRNLQGGVELGADPAHLRLGDPRLQPERDDQIVDLPGRDAMDVGLDHHREQRPVDPAGPLQHRREEAALAQLRDPQLDITGLRREQPVSSPVAMRRARRRAFMGLRADHLGRLRVDQRLEHQLHRTPNNIEVPTSADRVEQVDKVRLREGHRGVSFACSLDGSR
jgi:hypothetical protein